MLASRSRETYLGRVIWSIQLGENTENNHKKSGMTKLLKSLHPCLNAVPFQLFLCAMYVPVCTPLERPLPPCRSLCESARLCEPLMKKFGFPWPKYFECRQFSSTDDALCIGQQQKQTLNVTTSRTIEKGTYAYLLQSL